MHLRLGGKVGEGLTESDIYMDILRDQEVKKKSKKVKKLKKEKKKKSKRRKSRDSEDEDAASDNKAADLDSDEELFRFFEEQPETKKSKRRSGEKERQVSGSGDGEANKPVRKRFVRAKFDSDDLDLESENIASRDSEEVSSGKKKLKGKRRTSNEVSREKQLLADLSTSSLETLLSRARSTKKAQICSRK